MPMTSTESKSTWVWSLNKPFLLRIPPASVYMPIPRKLCQHATALGSSSLSDNPVLSERGRSVFLSAFLPEGQESTRASSPALSGPCSRRRQHAQPGALRGVRGPLDRVFPNRCGYPHRGQAHRRSEIGTILPLAPLSPVSRGKIEETDSGKTDYRNSGLCVAVCEYRWFLFQNYRKVSTIKWDKLRGIRSRRHCELHGDTEGKRCAVRPMQDKP